MLASDTTLLQMACERRHVTHEYACNQHARKNLSSGFALAHADEAHDKHQDS